MKSFQKINTIQTTLLVLSAVALAAGCSTESHTQATRAPVLSATHYTTTTGSSGVPIYTAQYNGEGAMAAGAPGNGTETQTGAGAQGQGGTTVIPLYKEEVVVGTRQVPAGTVRLHKSVKTETFNQPVQLRQETLSINRVEPGAAGANAQTPLPPTGRTEGQNAQASKQPDKTFQDQEIVIQLYREEPVVQKQIVPSGQIVVEKQSKSQQMNVQDQVRREEIQISKSGQATNLNVAPNLQNTMQDQEQPTATGAPSSDQEETSGTESGGKGIDQ